MSPPRIDSVRLTDVPLEAVVALHNEPRLSRHLPLAGNTRATEESTADWVAAKDGQ